MYFTTENYAATYCDPMVECAHAHGWRVTSQPFFDVPHVTVRTRSRRDVLDLNARVGEEPSECAARHQDGALINASDLGGRRSRL